MCSSRSCGSTATLTFPTDSDPCSDIHPWDILVDGERWTGKIRLIGFVDVFFLICYSGTSRFDHGLMIFSAL